jgi:uncharacterized protein (TIGR02217 family)
MPTSFDDSLLDSSLMTLASGSPEFANTLIRNPATGIYKANINRYDPAEVWTLEFALLTDTQREYLWRFWRGGFGSAYGFRVRVPSDWKVVAEVIGTGNGSQTVFPLVRTYTRPGSSGHSNVRRIIKPAVVTNLTGGSATLLEPDGVTGRIVPHTGPPGTGQAFQVFKDGVNQVSGWTIHNGTGNITFSTAPANGVVISWSGEFDTPMRFMSNSFQGRVDVDSDVRGLTLCEILPAELGIT